MKNQSGFIHLHSLFVVIFVTIIIFSIGFIGAIIQIQQEIRSNCLTDSIAIQKEIIQSEKLLLQMNTASTSLKVAYYAAVAVSLFPPTAAAGQAQMRVIQTLRQNLDRVQKSIIKLTNVKAQIESAAMLVRLNQMSWKRRQVWSFYLNLMAFIRPVKIPKMAVHAVSSDLAPNYELDSDYKETQRLELSWQMLFATRDSAQSYLQEKSRFQLQCGALPERNNHQWSIEIIADKF